MKKTIVLTFLALSSCMAALAQNPISGGQKFLFGMIKNNIIRAAEKMPEENYAFKPTPDVRSFGQLVGHVADAQYMFCSAVLGKTNPALGIEKGKTAKADLVKALKEAFAYCDTAYDEMTDAQANTLVRFFGADQAKTTVLSFNVAHDNEHYGNMVTYMRLKGIVPPSSEKRQ
ncbi:DinB family protein [Bryobacter aggregatus]|uniref:DinB family protein n=1 Tax=Bryobacter aggregatus TaxID=360054 RepID=UPI0004E27DDE|nr:DinB family protein [Bryobacter aggregatus]